MIRPSLLLAFLLVAPLVAQAQGIFDGKTASGSVTVNAEDLTLEFHVVDDVGNTILVLDQDGYEVNKQAHPAFNVRAVAGGNIQTFDATSIGTGFCDIDTGVADRLDTGGPFCAGNGTGDVNGAICANNPNMSTAVGGTSVLCSGQGWAGATVEAGSAGDIITNRQFTITDVPLPTDLLLLEFEDGGSPDTTTPNSSVGGTGPATCELVGDTEWDTSTPNGSGYSMRFNNAAAETGTAALACSAFGLDTGDFTIAAWVYPDTYPQDVRIVDKDDGPTTYWQVGIEFDPNNRVELFFEGAGGAAGYNTANAQMEIPLTTWSHIVVTYDGSASIARFYRDGALVETTGTLSPGGLVDADATTAVVIGNNSSENDGTRGFDGLMDDVRVLAEVADLGMITSWYTPTSEFIGNLSACVTPDCGVVETPLTTDVFYLDGDAVNCVPDTCDLECDGDDLLYDEVTGVLLANLGTTDCGDAISLANDYTLGIKCTGGTCVSDPFGTVLVTIQENPTPDPLTMNPAGPINITATSSTVADASACSAPTGYEVDCGDGLGWVADADGVKVCGQWTTTGAKTIQRRADDGTCSGIVVSTSVTVNPVVMSGLVTAPVGPITVDDTFTLSGFSVDTCSPGQYDGDCDGDLLFDDVTSATPTLAACSAFGLGNEGIYTVGVQASGGDCGDETPTNTLELTVNAASPTPIFGAGTYQNIDGRVLDTNDLIGVAAIAINWTPTSCDFECNDTAAFDDGSRAWTNPNTTFVCHEAGGSPHLTVGDHVLGAECTNGVTTLSELRTTAISAAETAAVGQVTPSPLFEDVPFVLQCLGSGYTSSPESYDFDCDNGDQQDDGNSTSNLWLCPGLPAGDYQVSCRANKASENDDEDSISPTRGITIQESPSEPFLTNLIVSPVSPGADTVFTMKATVNSCTGTTWEADCDTDPDYETACPPGGSETECSCSGQPLGNFSVGLRHSGGSCSPTNPSISTNISVGGQTGWGLPDRRTEGVYTY